MKSPHKTHWNPGWYYHARDGKLYRHPSLEEQMKLLRYPGKWGDALPRRLRAKPLTRRQLKALKADPSKPRRDVRARRHERIMSHIARAVELLHRGNLRVAGLRMRMAGFIARGVF